MVAKIQSRNYEESKKLSDKIEGIKRQMPKWTKAWERERNRLHKDTKKAS